MITVSTKIRFIESVFGKAILHTKNVDVECPKCGKKRLSIRLEDDLNHCWVCGWSASTLLPLIKKFGSSEQLQEYTKVFLPENPKYNTKCRISIEGNDEEKEHSLKLPDDFKLLANHINDSSSIVTQMLSYLRKRGLSEKDFWYWKFGFSNHKNLFRRVVIPSFDVNGYLNYYVARSIDNTSFMKYYNCEVDKISVVFNELNIDWTKKLTLVEGPFDLVKCRGNATCLLGSGISEKSILFNKILENNTPVVLMLDSDMKNKIQLIAKKLQEYDIQTFIVDLGTKKDPGEMTFDEVNEAVLNAKQWNWNSYLKERIFSFDCSLRF